MRTLIFLCCLLTVAGCATVPVCSGPQSVVMSMELPLTLEFCSRPGPPEHEGRWYPSYEIIHELEDHFLDLTKMKSELCCFKGAQVRSPEKYLRQYFGILVNGKRLIYINAVKPKYGGEHVPKNKVLDRCNGGISCWGAIYDPDTATFSELAFNGLDNS